MEILKKKPDLWKEVLLYLLAAGVIVLNISLIFDNVVWGDEAFSLNTVRDTNFAGILQRIYFWDTHPPLYYFILKLFVIPLGSAVWVGHLASVVPFIIGIVFALIVWKKKLGFWPVAFFIILSGLSATCIQNNQEIRMYAWTFFAMYIGMFQGYHILTEKSTKADWVIMVIAADFAAYCHYYGMMTGGILITVVSLFYFLRNRGKTWLYGVCSVLGYIVLYLPWMSVLIKQMMAVKSKWWLEESSHLDEVLPFLFMGGDIIGKVLFPLLVIVSILIFLFEFGILEFRTTKETAFVLHKRFQRHPVSPQVIGLGMCWTVIVLMLIAPYFISSIYKPIVVTRYLYPVVPFALLIVMLCISYFAEKVGKKLKSRFVDIACLILMFALLVPALLDAKYFRSVTKTQNFQLSRILTEIGEPDSKTVFVSREVPHLAWTVLSYYYPQNEVSFDELGSLTYADEIWGFYPRELSENDISFMEGQGYHYQFYPDMFFGKYQCTMHHFWR